MKEIYISCGSNIGMATKIKNDLRFILEKLGHTVISNYKSLTLPDLANIHFISGTLSETKLVGIHADLLFYRYGDFYFNEKASLRFKTCVLYNDVEAISRYIDSIIREDKTVKEIFDTLNEDQKTVIYAMVGQAIEDTMLHSRILNIKNVKFNGPATIVFWTDGTKTVAKCSKQEEFDPEKGLAIAIVKKLIGDDAHLVDVFKKWVPKKDAERKPIIFDLSRMECVCPRCERITDAPWDNDKNPFYCRYCGQKIIFPEK